MEIEHLQILNCNLQFGRIGVFNHPIREGIKARQSNYTKENRNKFKENINDIT